MSYVAPHLRPKLEPVAQTSTIKPGKNFNFPSTPRTTINQNSTLSISQNTRGYPQSSTSNSSQLHQNNNTNRAVNSIIFTRTAPPTQGYQENNYRNGGNNRYNDTSNYQRKDPSDQFYSRNDVEPRNKGLESRMFGTAQNSGINFDKYDDIPVDVSGYQAPTGIQSFEEANLDDLIKSNISLANYSNPTPVQKNSIAIVTAKRDLMACAQTGSGKTAAFLIPILSELMSRGKPDTRGQSDRYEGNITKPSALILAPTRELAIQIFEEAKKFAYRSWIKPCVVYGGQPVREQLRELQRGCFLLVATPGRLVDLIDRGMVSLENICFLTLDEADRMLDMGFEPDIRRLVERSNMPTSDHRQTLMFSATFPKNIQSLARDFLRDYIFLTIGRVGSTSENITQSIEYVEDRDKRNVLLDILHDDLEKNKISNSGTVNLTLVFVETKRSADMLCNYLINNQFPATSIHGDRSQEEREYALSTFKSGKTPVLVATAVASRGLDIPNVTHVVNFDLPGSIDDYVHRIGRTGRAGNTGKATAFFNMNHDKLIVVQLYDILQEAKQVIPEWFENCRNDADRGGFGGSSGRGGRGGKRGGQSRGGHYDNSDFRKESGGGGYKTQALKTDNDNFW